MQWQGGVIAGSALNPAPRAGPLNVILASALVGNGSDPHQCEYEHVYTLPLEPPHDGVGCAGMDGSVRQTRLLGTVVPSATPATCTSSKRIFPSLWSQRMIS